MSLNVENMRKNMGWGEGGEGRGTEQNASPGLQNDKKKIAAHIMGVSLLTAA